MKILGLIGGTSWHSTVEYYQYINKAINEHFGNNTNPPLLVCTVNQAKIHGCQIRNDWSAIADVLIEGGERLQKAGAEKLMFCANTPHKVYDQVEKKLKVPIIHIADAIADKVLRSGVDKVCFLGTKYAMTQDFIKKRIANQGIKVVVPNDPEEVEELHRIIIEELTYGKVIPSSKKYVIELIQTFVSRGAEGVVLGCTEFPLMINDSDVAISVFNTTEIHAKAGVNFILEDTES